MQTLTFGGAGVLTAACLIVLEAWCLCEVEPSFNECPQWTLRADFDLSDILWPRECSWMIQSAFQKGC